MKTKPTIVLPDKVFGLETPLLVTFAPLLGLVLVVIASINLVIVPKFSDFKSMMSEAEGLEKKNAEILEKTRYLQSIDSEELQKNSDLINNSLLPQKNAYMLVSVIKKVAENHTFQIDSFSVSPGKLEKEGETVSTKKGIVQTPVKVAIVGPKASYMEFIKALERTLPVLSIESFKMMSSGSIVRLDMEIMAFYIEDDSKFDISKLTLADLTLKEEETNLVASLSEYKIVENSNEINGGAEYKKYNRTNPFTR